jgi:hypothetical protein
MDEQLMAVIMQLQREYFERWQSWPTVAQILAQLEGVQKES